MNFLQQIYLALMEGGDRPVLQEGNLATTARELQAMVAGARAFLRRAGVAPGDRVALIGDNCARWVALDLAIMFEGALTVPFYARQAPAELEAMMRDCAPALVLCGSRELLRAVDREGVLFEEAFVEGKPAEPAERAAGDAVRIVYTSGTSGDPKGVVYTLGNVDFMLPRVLARVDELMRGHRGGERVFHYLPVCFAGSWILMLTCLVRRSRLAFCTDLKRLKEEMRAADPHWMLNVPLLLERIRTGVLEQLAARGPVVRWLAARPALAALLLYPRIRRALAPSLKALICGSAPLAGETQRFFMMLGIPVLQVYGLTETTAICTMDRPGHAVPGKVGAAVEGCEMRVDGHGEIQVRGPNVFPGYWGREPHTGWLATGDLGAVDADGNWSIVGRAKFVLVLASGHNVPPEPIEEKLRLAVPGATQVMLVGQGRKFLAALVAGSARREDVERAVAALQADLPHYKAVRAFRLCPAFTPEDGLLTANGKLRRAVIAERYRKEIEEMYS